MGTAGLHERSPNASRCTPLRIAPQGRASVLLRLSVVAALACFLFAPPRSAAQQGDNVYPLVSVGAGYHPGIAEGAVPIFAGSTDCGEFTSGTASALAAFAGVMLPSLIDDRLGLGLRIGLASASSRLSEHANEPLYYYVRDSANQTGRAERIEHEYRLNGSWTLLHIDLLAHLRISSSFSLVAGPWIGQRLVATVSQTEALVNEPDYRFEGGRLEQEVRTGPAVSPTSFTFGAAAALGYSFPLSRRVRLAPELAVRAELGSVLQGFPWRTYSIGLNVAAVFDLRRTPDPPQIIAQDTAAVSRPAIQREPEQPARVSRLRASLDFFGVDEENQRLPAATIRVYEVLYRQRASLLESVYFDHNSASLPERYVKLDETGTARFAEDSLFGLDPLKMHYHALNLIGTRLRRNPDAMLTLAGAHSRGERASLALARAATVKQYLVAAWGIDSSRIVTTTEPVSKARDRGEDQRAESRRVSIMSSKPAVVDPVLLSRLRRDFEPPLVSLDPRFESDAGIRRWSVDLLYDGRVVGHFSDRDTGGRMNMNWQITDASVANTFLAAELTVEDSLGTVASTRTQVPLVIERNLRIVDRLEEERGKETITYSLLAFNRGSVDLNRRNRSVVNEVAAAVRPGARITVVGYTDRTGSESTNDALSRRRASNVAAALRAVLKQKGVRNVRIEVAGGGYEAGRFDNQLPEGRALSREVDVVVDQGG